MKHLCLFVVVVVLLRATKAAVFKGTAETFPVNEENSLKVRDALLTVIVSNSAAFSFYHQLMPKDNLVFSPLSITNVLALIYSGARNSTAEELEDVLGFNSTFLHTGLRSIRESLMDDIKDCSVHTIKFSNALMYCSNYSITEAFRSDAQVYYLADLLEHEPDDDNTMTNLVNTWVTDITNGKMKTTIPDHPSTYSGITFLNALYFKAPWKFPFDPMKTETSTFFNLGYKATEVHMMYRTVRALYGYYPSIDSFILELPYSGLDVDAMFLLPRQRTGMYKLETTIDIQVYNTLHQTMYNTEVEVAVPKFRLEDTIELPQILMAIGVKEIFSETADLSGISQEEDLFVSQILHTTTFDVTEAGTEATSASKATIQTLSLKPTFYLNHPFMFILKHRWTGAILFMGKVQML